MTDIRIAIYLPNLSPNFNELISGFRRGIRELDLGWEYQVIQHQRKPKKLHIPLGPIQGVVYAMGCRPGKNCPLPTTPAIVLSEYPALARSFGSANCPRLNQKHIGHLAFQHLYRQGYRHMACMGGGAAPEIQQRYLGFQQGCEEYGLSCSQLFLRGNDLL